MFKTIVYIDMHNYVDLTGVLQNFHNATQHDHSQNMNTRDQHRSVTKKLLINTNKYYQLTVTRGFHIYS